MTGEGGGQRVTSLVAVELAGEEAEEGEGEGGEEEGEGNGGEGEPEVAGLLVAGEGEDGEQGGGEGDEEAEDEGGQEAGGVARSRAAKLSVTPRTWTTSLMSWKMASACS